MDEDNNRDLDHDILPSPGRPRGVYGKERQTCGTEGCRDDAIIMVLKGMGRGLEFPRHCFIITGRAANGTLLILVCGCFSIKLVKKTQLNIFQHKRMKNLTNIKSLFIWGCAAGGLTCGAPSSER